jgi:hypothetical protein
VRGIRRHSWGIGMGADFSSHQFFAGTADLRQARRDLIDAVRRSLLESGFEEAPDEAQAERSFVVGPAGRWIFLGDSAGSTEWADPESFDALSVQLTALGPIVDVNMSDSAAVHFYLYRQGQLVDKFGNAEFPFYRFASEEAAAPYRGKPELWADLLLSPSSVEELRSAWVQEWRADEIYSTTARLLGWDQELAYVGYTFDYEGIPEKWDDFLGHRVDLRAFDELHFRRGGGAA